MTCQLRMYLDENFIDVTQLTHQDFLDILAEPCVAKTTHDLDHRVPISWHQKSIVAPQPHIEGFPAGSHGGVVWLCPEVSNGFWRKPQKVNELRKVCLDRFDDLDSSPCGGILQVRKLPQLWYIGCRENKHRQLQPP